MHYDDLSVTPVCKIITTHLAKLSFVCGLNFFPLGCSAVGENSNDGLLIRAYKNTKGECYY